MALHQGAQFLFEHGPHAAHLGEQVAAFQFGQHGEAGAAGEGIAAEGAGVVAGTEEVAVVFHGQGTDGDAAAQSLGQGEGVRFHPQLLVAPQLAAAAHADLHLVEDQQDVVGIAELAHPAEEGQLAGMHAPFALQGLKQHGGHPGTAGLALRQQTFKCGRVVVGEVAEALHHRLEALVVLGLAGGGDRGQGAAVEAGLGGEDQGPLLRADATHQLAMLAGQLDGRLIGLSAGIAEEHPVEAAAGRDRLRQLLLFRDPVQIGHVLQPAQLAVEGLAQTRVAVAQGAHGDAGHAVEVAAAVLIPHPHTLSSHQLHREAGIGVHHRVGGVRGWRDGSGGTRTHMPEGARF